MPEGPEVWILSKAINRYYIDTVDVKTNSYGKHLIINDIMEDWSFGLTGKLKIDHNNNLKKINTGFVYGQENSYKEYDELVKGLSSKSGTDWMISSRALLEKEVNKWVKSKRKLAALILDQTKITGIGVAWGSEILFKAELRPDVSACEQNLDKLVDTMIIIREEIEEIYTNELDKNTDKLTIKEFIDGWFSNLYEIREMNIYKKGTKLEVLGRNWWI
jgi:formamidopyrimidine-DNA glycosylase